MPQSFFFMPSSPWHAAMQLPSEADLGSNREVVIVSAQKQPTFLLFSLIFLVPLGSIVNIFQNIVSQSCREEIKSLTLPDFCS
ncbi:MAG: hypothetical protein FJ125_15235, partial [Deltaproteobacteria bacterium]|nr:hypothetical protein [Deltaproteobacteria bacterium]